MVTSNLKNICHLENISSVEWGFFYGKLTQLGRVGALEALKLPLNPLN